MTDPVTSLVILTFNCLRYTQACLMSIRRFTEPPYELIVVDNNSTDGTPAYLEAQPDIQHLICNRQNLGYAKGNNQGMQVARGQFILLLNNDVIVTPGWLPALLAHFACHPRLGILGPRTNQISGIQKIEGLDYHPWDQDAMVRIAGQRQQALDGQLTLTSRVAGFCMMVKRQVVTQIGYLDERFETGNYEDDDYCKRAQLAGFDIGVAEDVFVHHFGSVSFLENRIDYQGQMARNRAEFLKKWGKLEDYQESSYPEIRRLIPHQFETVLAIGCGAGAFGQGLKERDLGAWVAGIESSPQLCRQAADRLDQVICGDTEQVEWPFAPASFDCLVFIHSLAYMQDPWQALRHYLCLLKPDGIVVLSLANFRHFSVLQKWLAGAWGYESAGILDQRTLRFFTFHDIYRLLQEAGLQADSWHSTPSAACSPDQVLRFQQVASRLAELGYATDTLATDLQIESFIVVAGRQQSAAQWLARYRIDAPRIYWREELFIDTIATIKDELCIETQNARDRNITVHATLPEKIRLTAGTLVNIARLPALLGQMNLEGLERLKSMDDIWVSQPEDQEDLQRMGISADALWVLPALDAPEMAPGWAADVRQRIRQILDKQQLLRSISL